MLRSVKNLSDELGVEKFRIYKFIKDNDLKVTHLGSSKIMYFDDREAEKIIRAFTPELAYEDEHGEPMPVKGAAPPANAPAPAQKDETPETVREDLSGAESSDSKDKVAPADSVPEDAETGSAAGVPAESTVEADRAAAGTFPYDEVLLDLRRELEIKNRQIETMNQQLSNMTGALRNANDCIKRLSEGTRNLTESLRASQAMYLSAVQSISEEQEKTRLLQGQVAEAEADREAARKEAEEDAAAVREAARQEVEENTAAIREAARQEVEENTAAIREAARKEAEESAAAIREAARQEAQESAAAVREATKLANAAKETAEKAADIARKASQAPKAESAPPAAQAPRPNSQPGTGKPDTSRKRRPSIWQRLFGR